MFFLEYEDHWQLCAKNLECFFGTLQMFLDERLHVAIFRDGQLQLANVLRWAPLPAWRL